MKRMFLTAAGIAIGISLNVVSVAWADPISDEAVAVQAVLSAQRQCNIAAERVEDVLAIYGEGHPYVESARSRAQYWCGDRLLSARAAADKALPAANRQREREVERIKQQTEDMKAKWRDDNQAYIDCLRRYNEMTARSGYDPNRTMNCR